MPDLPGFVVAIDGPSGSGKSSVSLAVAKTLGYGYLDTGAMYRAVTWWLLDAGIDLAQQEVVASRTPLIPLRIATDPTDRAIRVGDADITDAIRETRISSRVSEVATNLEVRAWMRDAQRRLILAAAQEHGGVVAEGRDITTVVAPDAPVRILLTASEEARLRRRSTELHGHADETAVQSTRDQIVRRDAADSTVSTFTEAADGVTLVDTSDLDFEGSVQAVLDVVAAAQQAHQHADAVQS